MNLPGNPASKKAIKDVMVEISNSMTRMDAERDYIKEAVGAICEEHEINKKVFRKLVRTYHKQNFSTEVAEHAAFESMYGELVGDGV